MNKKKIAVIGAGISGAVLAYKLAQSGLEVKIFEKSRGAGGRMATRRFSVGEKNFFIDHGAQFIDVNNLEFFEFIQSLQREGLIKKFDLIATDNTFVPVPHMNSIAKFLINKIIENSSNQVIYQAEVLKVQKNIELVSKLSISISDSPLSNHSLEDFDLVVSTAPPLQSLQIFSNFDNLEFLKNVKMNPFFAVMLISNLNYDFGFVEKFIDEYRALSWIGINSKKPLRDKTLSLILHSNSEWTKKNIDLSSDEIIEIIIHELESLTGFYDSEPIAIASHRWLYGRTQIAVGREHFFDKDQGIALCGDYFIGDNIESAYLSASSLAKSIINKFS
ncbi:MAG: hypothetical protein RLZZ361_691 [Cyanobacteriota bacterium]|jgi:predicted NAD/FAD-dependent oxidoreductase